MKKMTDRKVEPDQQEKFGHEPVQTEWFGAKCGDREIDEDQTRPKAAKKQEGEILFLEDVKLFGLPSPEDLFIAVQIRLHPLIIRLFQLIASVRNTAGKSYHIP